MAYEGYLLKFVKNPNDFIFPLKYIKWGTYDTAPGQRQSLDAYTDLNGVTQDNALEHTKTEIKFTVNPMSEKEWNVLMGSTVNSYLDFDARDLNIIYYDFEQRKYRTGHFYFDKSFRVSANVPNNKPYINETNWTFIEH